MMPLQLLRGIGPARPQSLHRCVAVVATVNRPVALGVGRGLEQRQHAHASPRWAAAGSSAAPAKKGHVTQYYEDRIAQGELEANALQFDLCDHLDTLYRQMHTYKPPATSWLGKLLGGRPDPASAVRGLYIWGTVGSGKTMLMDAFFDLVPYERKRRVHFHKFMLDVHKRIHAQKMANVADPIPPVAVDLMREAPLLCFDEFQVTDVADAMILKRLFAEMFQRGLVMIATSNRPPEDLYKGGLQRSQFLPFIPLLKAHTTEVRLSAEKDYRMQGLMNKLQQQCFFHPLSDYQNAEMERLWQEVCAEEGAPIQATSLQLQGRQLRVPRACGQVAHFSFHDLCEQPVAAADYLRITETFHTVFLTGVPRLTRSDRDAARRFITLVDCLYDNAVKLVFSAADEPQNLFAPEPRTGLSDSERALMDDLKLDMSHVDDASIFTGEDEKFAWARLVSRLNEMQCAEYWTMCHKFWKPQQQ